MRCHRILTDGTQPGLPIWAVSKLKGQPKRDGSIIVRFCKARQSPVYPLVGVELGYGFGGIVGAVPTINTTLGACEGLDVVVAMVVSPRPERAGQADQDGRPSGAARAAIDLSVVRGVGSSTVVPGSVGSYRPVIAGAKLREGTTTILPRGRALQGVGLSSMRFSPHWRGT